MATQSSLDIGTNKSERRSRYQQFTTNYRMSAIPEENYTKIMTLNENCFPIF